MDSGYDLHYLSPLAKLATTHQPEEGRLKAMHSQSVELPQRKKINSLKHCYHDQYDYHLHYYGVYGE